MLITALVLLLLVIVAIIARDLQSASRVPLLEPLLEPPTSLPSLTVIIPARNEAARIGRCLAGLAEQQFPDLNVLVLDDSSTDGTADVVRSFRDRLPGVEVVRGAPLPDGWAGKCWACWQAANATDAAWIMFLDADTAPLPGMVARLLQYASTERLDLLTLLPLLELRSFSERVLMPPFTGIIQATFPLDRVNDPRSPLALANGQCILVRREVYFAVDGHRAVRDSVLEDVRLAQTVKGAGYTIRAVGGPRLMRVRMYTRLSEVAEGLQKNAFAGTRASGLWRTAWGGFRQALLATAPTLVFVSGVIMWLMGSAQGTIVVALGLAMLVVTLGYWGYVVHRLNQLHPVWGVVYPLGTLVYFGLAGIAFLSILRGRGVTWKGRTYRG
jgi:chlorobactene glucosyltransferase